MIKANPAYDQLTTYVVTCDVCGEPHQKPGETPDASVLNAQGSGWHAPSLMPGEKWLMTPVRCPRCREK
jgi:hypothetical protein